MRWLNILLLLLLLGLQYRLWIGPGSWADVAALKAEIEVQQQRTGELEKRNRLLEEEVINLKSGVDALEERARGELGMTRKDETFYLIVDK
ncbi:MAG: cell division protein FtsB [Spongiibacteraceae bacterium]|jgi:cell division protein FtsB|nr:cell division protein FtsB [Spongiibacteraceae bacterium]